MEKYESETTLFLREFLARHPDVVEKQKQARASWWDKTLDADQQRAFAASAVPKKPYEYYTNKT